MAKYLFEVRYGSEAIKGLAREGGSSRRDAAAKLVESVGGKLEAFYFAFGDVDIYLIADLPSEAHAVAVSLAVNQPGVATARWVVLIAPETVDAATKLSASFRPSGQ